MPIQMILEESKNEIVTSINEICNKYNLNYYLLEIIIKNLYNEVLEKKQIELLEVKKEYEKSLKESDK